MLEDPSTRRHSVGWDNQGVFSFVTLSTIGSKERFMRTSESSIIAQIMPYGLDVFPVTFHIAGIIHVDICGIMFKMLTILLCGLTHSPPFMDGYLGSPE